jgi:predicted SAM-dependent methyltransferase
MKLNIGSGDKCQPGFEKWDIKYGKLAYPLDLPDNSVEEIYASHILEHFSHKHTLLVLRDWVRALRPGGKIKIAVPDLNKIIDIYVSGQEPTMPIEAFIMGGHMDNDDVHRSVFVPDKLKKQMELAGLKDVVEWYPGPDFIDCSSYGISLNLEGTKPVKLKIELTENKDEDKKEIKIGTKIIAAYTTPRLGFYDTFDCITDVLPKFGIPHIRGTGVFWGHAMTAAMLGAMEKKAEWILCLDYDSIFVAQDLKDMFAIINKYPNQIDALVPHQWSRHSNKPIWSPITRQDLDPVADTVLEDLYKDVYPLSTGHFGLTLIRVSVLEKMKHPWFFATPNKDGRWEEGKIDEDINFWHGFKAVGGKIFLATDVCLGHLELDIRWPGQGMDIVHQHFLDYRKSGKPDTVFGGVKDKEARAKTLSNIQAPVTIAEANVSAVVNDEDKDEENNILD